MKKYIYSPKPDVFGVWYQLILALGSCYAVLFTQGPAKLIILCFLIVASALYAFSVTKRASKLRMLVTVSSAGIKSSTRSAKRKHVKWNEIQSNISVEKVGEIGVFVINSGDGDPIGIAEQCLKDDKFVESILSHSPSSNPLREWVEDWMSKERAKS